MKNILSSIVYDSLRPPMSRSLVDWADNKRILSGKFSSKPGKWKTSFTPYLREPMELIGNYNFPKIVLMTSSQVGKSEFGINFILHAADEAPRSSMIILPGLEDARKWSRGRLRSSIDLIPSLSAKIPKANSRKDGSATALDIQFADGAIQLNGSNSAAGLSSTPVGDLLLDEIDRYSESAGGSEHGEGDPVSLAEARTTTYRDRTIAYTSTPSIKGISKIESLFHSGDQRRWNCKCSCGHVWVWKFDEHVKFDDGDPDTARLLCPGCGTLHEQEAVDLMSKNGFWVKGTETPDVEGVASFHIWAIHSPWVTMKEIVQQFLEAKKRPETLHVFINTVLGESWEIPGESIEFEAVSQRIDVYGPDSLPADALLMTGAIDIQANRLEFYAAAWNQHEGHYGILHLISMGEPDQEETWKPIIDLVHRRRFTTHDKRRLRVSGICVDMGYKPDAASKGIQALRKVMPVDGKVIGIRGASTPSAPKIGKAIGTSKKRRGSSSLTPRQTKGYWIGVSAIKDVIQFRLKRESEEGGWKWCDDFKARWFKQLSAEHRTISRVQGKIQRIWKLKPGHVRNEALDLCVYSYAALLFLKPQWAILSKKLKKKPVLENASEPEAETGKKVVKRRRRKLRIRVIKSV